jgi:hypothetical protein
MMPIYADPDPQHWDSGSGVKKSGSSIWDIPDAHHWKKANAQLWES